MIHRDRLKFLPGLNELELRKLPAVSGVKALSAGPMTVSKPKPDTTKKNALQRTATTITYKGDSLQLSIVTPNTTAPPQGWPVLFAVHGGGWYRFDRNQILAGLPDVPDGGVAVVAPDYTLAKGNQASWPDNLTDLIHALDWVLNNGGNYGLDSSEITLMGQSAGGHLAALLAIQVSGQKDHDGGPLVDGLASVSGPMNLPGLVGQNAFATGKAQTMLGASYKANPTLWQAASPAWLLQSDPKVSMPPTLLIHGTADPVVPVDQSIAFDTLLEQRKVPVSLVQIDKAGHELLRGRTGKKVQAMIVRFINGLSGSA